MGASDVARSLNSFRDPTAMEMDGFSDRLIGGLMVSLPGIEPSAFSSALTGGWSACMQMKCRHANEPRGSAQILTGDGEEKRKIFFLIFDWIFFFYLRTKLRRRSGNNTHTHTHTKMKKMESDGLIFYYRLTRASK